MDTFSPAAAPISTLYEIFLKFRVLYFLIYQKNPQYLLIPLIIVL